MKLNHLTIYGLVIMSILFTAQCGSISKNKKLPILGEHSIVNKTVNGKEVTDTIYHTISQFSFVDQNGDTIGPASFREKIYVADFFFTSCPTICPKMHYNMDRAYQHFKGNPGVAFLSHSIDPVRDSVPVLKDYAERLEVYGSQWHFVTGVKDSIYAIAEDYLVSAAEDPDAPGGYIHSGAFILIDKQGRIRAYYDGTDPGRVDRMIKDMDLLLKED